MKDIQNIPQIIHQVYEDMNGPPVALSKLAKSWQKYHPVWEYRFWNKGSINDFLESYFPDYKPVYLNFSFNVQRWDFIRYLILYHFGGLYADMDYECFVPLDSLLKDENCCMGLEPASHAREHAKTFVVGNALMATVPGHPYFVRIIEDMIKNKSTVFSNYYTLQILESTGPFLTTRVYNAYPEKEQIKLLPDELIAPLSLQEVRLLTRGDQPKELVEKVEKAYAIHYFMGSWHI